MFPIRVLPGEEAVRYRDELEEVARACGEKRRRFDNLHLFFSVGL